MVPALLHLLAEANMLGYTGCGQGVGRGYQEGSGGQLLLILP